MEPLFRIGVEFLSTNIIIGRKKIISAQIWDSTGHEQFRSQMPAYYGNAAGAIIFC